MAAEYLYQGRRFADQPEDRYEPEPNSGCWLWTGPLRMGYGICRLIGSRRNHQAHRVIYEQQLGEIPLGLELDHRCRNPQCVNPGHLDPVTHLENVRRTGRGMKPNCKHGHAYTPENTYRQKRGFRVCRTCQRIAWRQWQQRQAVS